jgi:hypothetical protein
MRGDGHMSLSQRVGPGEGQSSRALLLAPFIFVCHFLEEAPDFVEWFNAHVSRGISPETFWRVNLSGLAITALVVGLERSTRSASSLGLAVMWLSFLMPANAALHVAGCVIDGQYVPGLATAVLLYLPYYSWLVRGAVRGRRIRALSVVGAALFGSVPMLIHGYLILFRGSRLF